LAAVARTRQLGAPVAEPEPRPDRAGVRAARRVGDAGSGVAGQARLPAAATLLDDEGALAGANQDAFGHVLSSTERLHDEHARVRLERIAEPGPIDDRLLLDEDLDVPAQAAAFVAHVEGEPGRELLHLAHDIGDRRR